jgi:hypothetical protein
MSHADGSAPRQLDRWMTAFTPGSSVRLYVLFAGGLADGVANPANDLAYDHNPAPPKRPLRQGPRRVWR